MRNTTLTILFILFTACAVLPAQAKTSKKQAPAVTMEEVASAVTTAAQAPQSDKLLYDIFTQQLDKKRQELESKRSIKATTMSFGSAVATAASMADSVYNDVVKQGGIAYFEKRTFSAEQIREMYFAQEIPPTMEWVGKHLENSNPERMLIELETLRSEVCDPNTFAIFPNNRAKSFTFAQTYLYLCLLLETNNQIENLE